MKNTNSQFLSLNDLLLMKSTEDKISLTELGKKIQFHNPRTLDTTPNFPKPTIIENEYFYPISEVCTFFNVESLDEPFIGIEEAAKILDITPGHLTKMARDNKVHSYYLKKAKGSRILFRESELNKFKEEAAFQSITPNTHAINLFMANLELKKLFIYFLKEQGTGFLTVREEEVLTGYLCENRSYEYLAKKFDLNKAFVKRIFQRSIQRVRSYITEAHQKKVADIYKENIDLKVKIDHLTVKLQAMDLKFADEKDTQKFIDIYEEWIDFAIKKINLDLYDIPVRAFRAFRALDIYTYYDLFKIYHTEFKSFMKVRNVGKLTMMEVEDFILRKSIKFNYINEAFFTHSKFDPVRKQIEFKIKHSN